MRTTAKGFTLIELIVVITIIAILAASALPRFINVQGDARIAKTNAILGSMRSAAALAKSRCELDLARPLSSGAAACNSGTQTTIDMDGANIDMIRGYPTAAATGILAAAQINLSADGVNINAGNPGGAGENVLLNLDIVGGTVGSCMVSYQSAHSAGGVLIAPTMSATTTGC